MYTTRTYIYASYALHNIKIYNTYKMYKGCVRTRVTNFFFSPMDDNVYLSIFFHSIILTNDIIKYNIRPGT